MIEALAYYTFTLMVCLGVVCLIAASYDGGDE